MSNPIINVPDLGSGEAEVIEVLVATGDSVAQDDPLLVLESDKATMEVPAPHDGVVGNILVKVGDTLSEGMPMMELASGESAAPVEAPKPEAVVETSAPAPEPTPAVASAEKVEAITVPDIGAESAPVVEISVSVGQTIEKDDSLVVLESDKATVEVPSPFAGTIESIVIKEGDVLTQGDVILHLKTTDVSAPKPAAASAAEKVSKVKAAPAVNLSPEPVPANTNGVHAGPAVRKLAREFGVDLTQVSATGPKDRILKEDVQQFVKSRINGGGSASTGSGIPAMPAVDFAKWGEVDTQPLNKLRKVAAQNFQRAWLNIPHVTQFDECDISELETFRKSHYVQAHTPHDTKLTVLPFILKAVAHLLKTMPIFCSSLSSDGESVVYKKYVNIGVAVDTPDGLLVPVIKNVDKKSLFELASECIELAIKARDKKLKPDEMQGGCFTISSLGSIGGTSFTPLVNAPEVAILGLSKTSMKPVWNGKEFEPKLMLPLSLSYDHRVVNGADAAKFTTQLGAMLADVRTLLL